MGGYCVKLEEWELEDHVNELFCFDSKGEGSHVILLTVKRTLCNEQFNLASDIFLAPCQRFGT